MKNYAVLINTEDRLIVIDDRNAQEEYVFTEGKNPYERTARLMCDCLDLCDVVPIEMEDMNWHIDGKFVMFETNINPIGQDFPMNYDIEDFDAFYNAMKSVFGN